MSQHSFDFNDDRAIPHALDLDDEQRQSIVELMSHIVIHVFQLQEKQSDEQSQQSQQD